MDADLAVDCTERHGAWTCRVTVKEGSSQTQHEVTVTQQDVTRYMASNTSVVALVSEAFMFLLEREPKESILRSFALSDIERYFPEFGRR